MGTTVDALMVVGDEVAIAHIGDSRIYLYRDGELTQITTDHTFVQRLVDSGRITAAEARMHPRRSVLMRVLGDVDTSPELDVFAMTIHDGDRWIICSDGLSDYVDDRDTLQIVSAGQNAQKTADRLVKKTLDNGAPDNVTVVVLDIGAKSSKSEPVIVGSVSQPLAFEVRPSRRTGLIPRSGCTRAASRRSTRRTSSPPPTTTSRSSSKKTRAARAAAGSRGRSASSSSCSPSFSACSAPTRGRRRATTSAPTTTPS